jgi:hypothetical protein
MLYIVISFHSLLLHFHIQINQDFSLLLFSLFSILFLNLTTIVSNNWTPYNHQILIYSVAFYILLLTNVFSRILFHSFHSKPSKNVFGIVISQSKSVILNQIAEKCIVGECFFKS